MEFKDLSITAESTLKFAKEDAEREFEKIRQKYVKNRNANAVHLTTSVEEYETALTELRLKILRENLDAYYDVNPKLYEYVRMANAKKEIEFRHEHNKIHRHDVTREAVMKEIATRRYNLEKVIVGLEKAAYEKEKYVKNEKLDYDHRVELDKMANQIIADHHAINPNCLTYEEFYKQILEDFNKICQENKQLMADLFEKVNVLVKQNYEKISMTEEKAKMIEISAQRDQIARELLAKHRQILDDKVDLKVLKTQLREKLPVEETYQEVENKIQQDEAELKELEAALEAKKQEISQLEAQIKKQIEEYKKEFLASGSLDKNEKTADSNDEIMAMINACFAKETDEIFDALIQVINNYAKNKFKPFDVYKQEKLEEYAHLLEDYKKEQLAQLGEKASPEEKNAYSLSLNEYLKVLHLMDQNQIKEEQERVKQAFASKFEEAKNQYLSEKAAIKQARKNRKQVYKDKKKEAKIKSKNVSNSFEKMEIRDTLLVYKKEIKEGDRAKYKKAKKNYRLKVKDLNEELKLALLGIEQPQTVILEEIYQNKLQKLSKENSSFEKQQNKQFKRQLSLAKYRKNMNKTKRENILGYIFLSIWAVGFVILTLYPLVYTFFLSFSKVGFTTGGGDHLGYDPVFFGSGKLFPNWVGLENYSKLFFNNTSFLYQKLPTFLMSMAFFLPIVVFIAFVLAMLLNTKIIGKTVFRIIYFLPVIIISGELLNMLQNDGGGTDSIRLTIDGTFIYSILNSISKQAVEYANFVFQNFIIILWMTGVPIVLFISGLQKIDRSLYEAAEIDGANKWQALWTVTFPLIKSVILIACLFTIVQIASIDMVGINPIKSSGDPANPGITELMQNQAGSEKLLGQAAAMAWVQTFIVLIFVLIVFLLFREKELVEKQKSYEEVERIKAKKARRKAKAAAFFHVAALKRGWAKITSPIVKWRHTRQMKMQKKKEEGGE